MPEPLIYRKQVLSAVEAFLQGTPASIAQGQEMINSCYSMLWEGSQRFTLDGLIWRSFVHPLTDSVYFTSQEYLQEIRNILQGFPSKERWKIFIKQDFRPYLTADEAEWYAQLLSMLDFIQSLPFAQIAEATADARQRKLPGNLILKTIPEAMPINEAYEDYQRRQATIATLVTGFPFPEHFGEETIYRFVLREVTDLVTHIDIRLSAIYHGYPSPLPPYATEGDAIEEDASDMSELFAWAKRALSALTGAHNLIFSWKLTSARSFDADLLLLSFH